MNTFRIAFMMERLSPLAGGLTGAFDTTYLSGLKTIVSYVTSHGGYAVLDPHNYARYNGTVITDTAAYVYRALVQLGSLILLQLPDVVD
jgi:endoglucanase